MTDRPPAPAASRRRRIVFLGAVVAAAALGWFAAGPSDDEDPLDQLLERGVPAAALTGLAMGLAVGAAGEWTARSDGDQPRGAGCGPVALWSAPVASLPFTAAWAVRDAGQNRLTADEAVATFVNTAVFAFVPSLVGLGLGTLAGFLVTPRSSEPAPDVEAAPRRDGVNRTDGPS